MQNCVLIVVTSTLSEFLFEAEVDASGVVDKNPLQHLLDVFEGGGKSNGFSMRPSAGEGTPGVRRYSLKGLRRAYCRSV